MTPSKFEKWLPADKRKEFQAHIEESKGFALAIEAAFSSKDETHFLYRIECAYRIEKSIVRVIKEREKWEHLREHFNDGDTWDQASFCPVGDIKVGTPEELLSVLEEVEKKTPDKVH